MTASVTLVVLAGGTSRRWGGVDKTAVPLPDQPDVPLLVRTITNCRAALGEIPVVVMAPSDHPARDRISNATWAQEQPVGSGPAAAIAAAGALVRTELIAVIAADTPAAGAALRRFAEALSAAPSVDGVAADGVVAVDESQRRHWLIAVLRRSALERASKAVGNPAGASVRDLMAPLVLINGPLSATESFDLDTPEAAARWAARHAEPANSPPFD